MRIAGREATRIQGTLQIMFEGGVEGSIDIDLDVSHSSSFLEIQNHYDDDSDWRFSLAPRPLLSQTFSIHVPPQSEQDPPLILRVPVPKEDAPRTTANWARE